jgi:CRP/FNR family transcriptional regulator, cyclic AMP receptor protein
MQPAAITHTPDALNGDVREAWTESCLASLAQDVAGRLLRDAHRRALAAGEPLHRGGDDPGTCPLALVVHGLLRLYRRAADGREVTVRYVGPGGLIGLPAVLGRPSTPALDCAALRASTLLVLQPDGFRDTIATDPSVASALCRYLSDELVEAQRTLAGDVLLPVRSRVACHLLSLAERHERELVVRATPQHLAAAVGSVREVVARVLRCMEQAGLVQRRTGQLVLVDTAALHRVWAGESGL